MGQLAEALKAGPPADARKRCGVCDWVATLDDEDRAWHAETLADIANPATSGWNYSNAHRACQKAGLKIELPRFTEHAKGLCGRE